MMFANIYLNTYSDDAKAKYKCVLKFTISTQTCLVNFLNALQETCQLKVWYWIPREQHRYTCR